MAGQDITFTALQERLEAFRDARDWQQFHTPAQLAAAVAVEVGELQELFLWSGSGDRVVADDREALEHELADVVITAMNLANVAGIDLGAAVVDKIDLNDKRYPVDKAKGNAKKWSEL